MESYRIVVTGQSWMGMRRFDASPKEGDVFEMASGNWFQINGIVHDPVPGSRDPEWLIQAQAVSSHRWNGDAEYRPQ